VSTTQSIKSDNVAAGKTKFAVFDIDGTLIRWQLYHVMVDKLAKTGVLGVKAHNQLHEARMIWKKRTHKDSFLEYEKTLIGIYEAALPKINAVDFDHLVEEIITEYQDQVYTYTRDLIKSLKKKNYFLLAISGSHHELVEKLAAHYGFDDWLGSKYERRGGKFSGEKYIPSLDKRSALENKISEHSLSLKGSIAVGDTKSDVAMLKMVEKPIAFNPERVLFKYASQEGWPIVVERKNVIYKLGNHDGRYFLV
jgi:HAD superfamily hydrolase (TIGR01490 family)